MVRATAWTRIFCVIQQESGFSSKGLSVKGAQGLMQLMPGTAARYGVMNANDPEQNIKGGTRYLKDLLQLFHGRIDLVLAGYNAGEGTVIKYGQAIPPYIETEDYVRRISHRYLRKPHTAPATGKPIATGAQDNR
jgi:soluble lytic murein transglycosylase-like protein